MFKKSLIILSLIFVFFSLSFSATKPTRNVYGVISETVVGGEDAVVHYWEWNKFTHSVVNNDVIEGKECWQIRNGKGDYGAIGLDLQNSLDMSTYTCVKFLVKVNSSYADNMKHFKVGIVANGNTYSKKLKDINGFVADGKWHELTVSLSECGSDLSNVTCLFFFQLGGGKNTDHDDTAYYKEGETIFFDNVRWVREKNGGGLKVTVKNVSDNSTVNTNTIVWNSNLFDKGWTAAGQYFDVDVDVDSLNWDVKLYLLTEKEGFIGYKVNKQTGEETKMPEYVMSVCWRATEYLLPHTDKEGYHSLEIGQKDDEYNSLYDLGSGDDNFFPWLYMQNEAALKTDKDKDYSTVLSYKDGFHGYSGVFGDSSKNGYYQVWKNIRVYLGANTKVSGGLKYKGDFRFKLSYE